MQIKSTRSGTINKTVMKKYRPQVKIFWMGEVGAEYSQLCTTFRPDGRLMDQPVSPTAVIVYMENIGFVYSAMSMMVIGPSLPILRHSRWSLLYDVY
jgi:hypothetical protein